MEKAAEEGFYYIIYIYIFIYFNYHRNNIYDNCKVLFLFCN